MPRRLRRLAVAALLPIVSFAACGGEGPSGEGADMTGGRDAEGPGGRDLAVPADLAVAPGPDLATPGCGALPLCDDFEGVKAGGAPDPKRWSVVSPNCAGTGTIAVDDSQAHGGGRSVRVAGKGGYCNHVFIQSGAAAGIGKVVYGRFWLRLGSALGQDHVTFLAMKDAADNGKDVRMGGQANILMWNRESDDATLPVLSPKGISLSVQPAAQKWSCVEFLVDGNQGFIKTWVDGAEVGGLQVDAASTPDVDEQWLRRANWRPNLMDFRLGWESYGGTDMTLWFDDVALAATRIGCN